MKMKRLQIVSLVLILLLGFVLLPVGALVRAETEERPQLLFPDLSDVEDGYLTTLDNRLNSMSTDSEYMSNTYQYSMDVPLDEAKIKLAATYGSFDEEAFEWGPVYTSVRFSYQLPPHEGEGFLPDEDLEAGIQPYLEIIEEVLNIDAELLSSLILKARTQDLEARGADALFYAMDRFSEFDGTEEELELLQNVSINGSKAYIYDSESKKDVNAEVVSLAIELVAEEALEGKDVGLALAEKVLAHLLELSDGQFETLNVTRSASNIQTGAYIRNSVTAESAEAFAEDEVLKYDTAMSYTIEESFPEPFEYSEQTALESQEEATEKIVSLYLEQIPETQRDEMSEKINEVLLPLFDEDESQVNDKLVEGDGYHSNFSLYDNSLSVSFESHVDAEGNVVATKPDSEE
ncbi:MAG TPA: hypothetical protein GXZ89_07115 [Fastidiosipila sp.]|nr:hypothetical protein [Fastidiosipila sp.]